MGREPDLREQRIDRSQERAAHLIGFRQATGGHISVLAGANFINLAAKDDPSLKALAEYALLGGLFYLASSILIRRRARAS